MIIIIVSRSRVVVKFCSDYKVAVSLDKQSLFGLGILDVLCPVRCRTLKTFRRHIVDYVDQSHVSIFVIQTEVVVPSSILSVMILPDRKLHSHIVSLSSR